jgi:hypothetical protein
MPFAISRRLRSRPPPAVAIGRQMRYETRTMRRVMLWVSMLCLLVSGGCVARDPFEAPHRAVAGAGPALRKAGTATVRFDASLNSTVGPERVLWRGTTRSRYGENPASATEFTEFTVGSSSTRVDLQTITVGDTRYHRTSRLRTPKGRPWVRLEPGRWLSYGTRAADPDLGLVDPEAYLRVLEGIPQSAALLAETDREDKIGGVRVRGYRLVCSLGSKTCPHSELGQARRVFPGTHQIAMTFWLDDDGRPWRLEGTAELDAGPSELGNSIFYRLKVTMDLGDFGRPIEIAEPAAAEVTTEVDFAS